MQIHTRTLTHTHARTRTRTHTHTHTHTYTTHFRPGLFDRIEGDPEGEIAGELPNRLERPLTEPELSDMAADLCRLSETPTVGGLLALRDLKVSSNPLPSVLSLSLLPPLP